MIEAIIQGLTDPEQLYQLAKGMLKNKKTELLKALSGRLTDHHRFMLCAIKSAIKDVDGQIEVIQTRIDLYKQTHRAVVNRLKTVPGISEAIAMNLLGEIGPNVQTFPDEHHLASWAGVCPGNNESAGKKKSERTVKGNKLLKTTLVEAAWSAVHTKNTFYQRKYHALVVRRGPKKAIVAIAHKIIKAVYFILKDQVEYREVDLQRWEARKRQTLEAYYHKRLNELSHQ
ncbi:transposase [Solitalea lacus]|uniref:transposase n=1 Tax=Solitalea lacus TaxID=2911172 RepID=UPI001EDACD5E|nr:transposase [Solitalea lacus]UKJ06244.1 transposase [Solitalea lacus]